MEAEYSKRENKLERSQALHLCCVFRSNFNCNSPRDIFWEMEHDLKQQEEQELPNPGKLTLNEADAKDDDSHIYKIKISMQPDGRSISLTLPANTTLLELKTDVYYITDIPVRHQVWSGWPLDVAVDNATNLAESGIGRRHSFVVQSTTPHNNSQSSSDFEADDKYE